MGTPVGATLVWGRTFDGTAMNCERFCGRVLVFRDMGGRIVSETERWEVRSQRRRGYWCKDTHHVIYMFSSRQCEREGSKPSHMLNATTWLYMCIEHALNAVQQTSNRLTFQGFVYAQDLAMRAADPCSNATWSYNVPFGHPAYTPMQERLCRRLSGIALQCSHSRMVLLGPLSATLSRRLAHHESMPDVQSYHHVVRHDRRH